jgi:hypothetical protein
MKVLMGVLADSLLSVGLAAVGLSVLTGLLALALERSRRRTCVAVLKAAPRGTLMIDSRRRGHSELVLYVPDHGVVEMIAVDPKRCTDET